ncbi:P-loop NTPase [Petroclostridium xylanilyticum]|uniref:P-loop NTPase n=1 Tax=Petroclostridium xylanilyticum TaxID=1792311 RepID=UPI000B97CF3D|nr:P-loop NTPase [Petroclostridium xylanilyticum]
MKQASEKNRNNGCPGEEKCNPEDFRCKTHELNDIKRTVAVLSGKGGVGKSLVTSLLGVVMRRKGYNIGILDADITGPSIPKVFGADDYRADTGEFGIYPARTHNDIKIMSINLLLEKNDFGESKAEKVAQEMDIPFLGRLPVDPDLAALCDKGEIEKFDKDYVNGCIEMLEKRLGGD